MVQGRVYTITSPPTAEHPNGVLVYVGSTTQRDRFRQHKSQCASLHGARACPLYRYANDTFPDGLARFTERTIATIELDDSDRVSARRALKLFEDLCIRTLRDRPNVQLLNRNRAVGERRAAQRCKAWRDVNTRTPAGVVPKVPVISTFSAFGLNWPR